MATPDVAQKQYGSPVLRVLTWASSHPGILHFGFLGQAVLLAEVRTVEVVSPERRPETEADSFDGGDSVST
jgi:hypothetical protein